MGPPLEGELVQLQWIDGIIYNAKFIAAQISQIYQASMEGGPRASRRHVSLLLEPNSSLVLDARSVTKGEFAF